jgi:hypothetical protein
MPLYQAPAVEIDTDGTAKELSVGLIIATGDDAGNSPISPERPQNITNYERGCLSNRPEFVRGRAWENQMGLVTLCSRDRLALEEDQSPQ